MAVAASARQAEISETALEVLVQEGVENRVEAAVGVAQGDAQVPAGYHEGVARIDLHHGLDDDEDVDGRPAHNESRHHHQDHAGDAPHISVFLLGARQQAGALQAQDHEAVADGDDHHGHHKGKDEDADLGYRVPVPVRLRELQHAHRSACQGEEERENNLLGILCFLKKSAALRKASLASELPTKSKVYLFLFVLKYISVPPFLM